MTTMAAGYLGDTGYVQGSRREDGSWSGAPGTDPNTPGVKSYTNYGEYWQAHPEMKPDAYVPPVMPQVNWNDTPSPPPTLPPQIGQRQLPPTPSNPPTLPPQIGQQQFGNSGIGSLGGGGGGGGQTNVSLNLQGSATMNGGNQNRGYPGMNSGSGTMGGGASGGAMGYAEGGSINASPRGLASFGRGGDTELIHMSKGEIRGLQQLALAHGGSLTINPHTGLPEAGFLKSLLPMIIGGALAATGVGAPLAALMVGGGYGLASGSLMKGLQAGMGAYGGAGLGTGLAEMGAEATANATNAANAANAGTSINAADQAAKLAQYTQSPVPGIEAAGLNAPAPVSTAAGSPVFDNVANMTPSSTPAVATPLAPEMSFAQPPQSPYMTSNIPAQKVADMSASEYATNAGKGFGQLDSMKGLSTLGNKVGMGTIGAALTPTLADTMYPERKGVGLGAYEPDEYDKRLAKYHLAENYQPYVPAQPNPYYRAQYAKGGGVSKYEGRDPESVSIPRTGIIKDTDPDTAPLDAYAATLARLKKIASRANLNYAAPTIPSTEVSPALKGLGDIGKPTAMMAAGGSLGGYSDGGHLLKGPGDGMSDNIPATINRKQPARLADGEFVVPADVVSHLGNGSTDAGAKKLYAMLNKVRTARTGRKAQGRQINPNKFMPA